MIISSQYLPLTIVLTLLLISALVSAQIYPSPSHENRDYWTQNAQSDLRGASQLYTQIKHHRAKNVAFFLGDGLGVTSVTAGRILKGQLRNQSGEEAQLAFERFPHTALIKTYNTDMQTPDSAGTATAYLGGTKAKSGTLGVDQHVESRNCASYSEANNVVSFLMEAHKAGKSVGVVTTTRVTHATPAASYAHIVWRDWEDDTDRNRDVSQELRERCPDIASQLIDKSPMLTVIFGGGRLKFLPRTRKTQDRIKSTMVSGTRSDGRNLINEWKQRNADRNPQYIETRDELLQLSPTNAGTVFGLFSPSHMQYDIDNQRLDASIREPSIREMTEKALQILKQNKNGFALLVEGGRIDHGHHENKASKALHDLVAFDSAIDATVRQVDGNETLLLVTADHSHVFTIGAWANRGTAIQGKVKFSYFGRYNSQGDALGADNLPYTAVSYGDGPSASINASRADLTNADVHDVNYMQSSIVNQEIESHGSEDVPMYATGPGAHLFHSTHEQSYVSHLVQHTLCIGEYGRSQNCLPTASGTASTVPSYVLTQLSVLAASVSIASQLI